MSLARESRGLLALQATLLAIVSGLFFVQAGGLKAGSVWFGGAIATANILLLMWRRRRADGGRALSAGESLRLLYRTALERFALVVLLFALGMGVLSLDPLALMAGFVVGQLALLLIKK